MVDNAARILFEKFTMYWHAMSYDKTSLGNDSQGIIADTSARSTFANLRRRWSE